jgi:hypothetical protein
MMRNLQTLSPATRPRDQANCADQKRARKDDQRRVADNHSVDCKEQREDEEQPLPEPRACIHAFGTVVLLVELLSRSRCPFLGNITSTVSPTIGKLAPHLPFVRSGAGPLSFPTRGSRRSTASGRAAATESRPGAPLAQGVGRGSRSGGFLPGLRGEFPRRDGYQAEVAVTASPTSRWSATTASRASWPEACRNAASAFLAARFALRLPARVHSAHVDPPSTDLDDLSAQ